jgi:hypothetical protein
MQLKPMKSDYKLSSADIDDCLAISRCFQSAAELSQWGGDGFVFPVNKLQFLHQLYKPDTESYRVLLGDTIVAFGQICDRFGKHHLARLLVMPGHRGKQLSYVLLLSLMTRALQQNPKLDFSLFVFKHNNVAAHCYQQLGFVEAKQPGASNPDLIFMQLSNQQARTLLSTNPWHLHPIAAGPRILCQQEHHHAHLD